MKLVVVSFFFATVFITPGIHSGLLHHPNLHHYTYPSLLNVQPLNVVQPQYTVIPQLQQQPLTFFSHAPQPLAPVVHATSPVQLSSFAAPVNVITLSRSVLKQLLAQSDALEVQQQQGPAQQQQQAGDTINVDATEARSSQQGGDTVTVGGYADSQSSSDSVNNRPPVPAPQYGVPPPPPSTPAAPAPVAQSAAVGPSSAGGDGNRDTDDDVGR